MGKRILIIDDDENIVVALALLFNEFGFEPVNSKPVNNKTEIAQMINHLKPDIIFLDHDLGAKDTGLDIAEIIPKNILILSTSMLVRFSRELTDSYRKAGIYHFSEKTFGEIIKCINGNCGCYLPAMSQPVF